MTKEDISRHLDANEIEVKDVTKGAIGTPQAVMDAEKTMRSLGSTYMSGKSPENEARFIQSVREYERLRDVHARSAKTNTKFSTYTLHGAEYYREVLLTLPDRDRANYQEW